MKADPKKQEELVAFITARAEEAFVMFNKRWFQIDGDLVCFGGGKLSDHMKVSYVESDDFTTDRIAMEGYTLSGKFIISTLASYAEKMAKENGTFYPGAIVAVERE